MLITFHLEVGFEENSPNHTEMSTDVETVHVSFIHIDEISQTQHPVIFRRLNFPEDSLALPIHFHTHFFVGSSYTVPAALELTM